MRWSVTLVGIILCLCNVLLGQSPHGPKLTLDCIACHTSEGWKIPAKNWDRSKLPKPRISKTTGRKLYPENNTPIFDHDSTAFALEGRHSQVDCRACHATLIFSGAETNCTSCHKDVHQQTVGVDCKRCHTATSWQVNNVQQLHQASGFPLINVHANLQCAACHTGENPLRFERMGNECKDCHLKDYQASQNPSHSKLNLSMDCASCHTTQSPDWKPATFDQHNDFHVLEGAHAKIAKDCAACHNGDYTHTPTSCSGCHMDNYQAALKPNHAQSNFPVSCEDCHQQDAWAPATFDHNKFFPFTGAHIPIADDCASCHHGNYSNTPNTCAGCHTSQFETAQNPNHLKLGISKDCASCHSTTPGWAPASFPIHDQFFPLTGAHASVPDCASCHKGDYQNTPKTCSACHQSDFEQAKNPDHTTLGISKNCEECHTSNAGWAPAKFPNHDQFYPLVGKHEPIKNNCAACHKDNNYSNTPNTCAACHNAEYTATKNPDHLAAKFPTDCESCHSPQGWSPSSFNHDQYYKLTGVHLSIKNNCAACHLNGNYTTTPNTCVGCHNADFKAALNPNHVESQLPQTCESCHSTQSWSPSSFDHNQHYPLSGAHQSIANDCKKCHQAGNFSSTPNTCAGCHTNDYNSSANPKHKSLGFSMDCAQCHTTTPGWAPATFPDHDKFYPLVGAHKTIANDCAACHKGNNYSNTPNTCAACHSADYLSAKNPDHFAAKLATKCESCHSPQGWSPSSFNHDQHYKLTGAHLSIKNNCVACHQNGNYTTTPNTCAGCHNADFKAALNPNHVESQLPQTCETCHSTQSWSPSSFDHNKHYPLTGAHQVIANDCKKCHQAGNFNSAPNTCAGCHTNDYNSSANPNHKTLGFSMDCAQCHSTTPGWAPATFPDHDKFYPLVGAHKTIASNCAACHKDNNYSNTPNTCSACHSADYATAKNPDHNAAKLPTNCESCHSPQGWSPSSFNHDQHYKLTGAHLSIKNNCVACHQNGNYTTTPNTCTGCHNADFKAALNPNHVESQLPQTCETCHSTQSWSPSSFDHNKHYPLVGAHQVIANDCKKCHQAGNFTSAPNTCVGCHNADYAAAKNPDHKAAKLSTNCESCHSQQSWSPSSFNHDQHYQLTGAHLSIKNNCVACHQNGNYTTTPNTCVGCHNADFKAALNPNHVESQLPQTCETCHSTQSWSPSSFDHNKHYPLVGAHQVIANDCKKCHQAGNFNSAPNTCAGCHTNDYNGSANPNHKTLGFSMDCAQCHSPTPGWSPAVFPDHDKFYVLEGAHKQTPNGCVDCHKGNNYSNTPTTCAACHSADYTSAKNPDHNLAKFPTNCESCHTPKGWSPSSFNHDQYYHLTGAHLNIKNNCAACHINGNYTTTPNTCAGCHTADYNNSVNPSHKTLGFSTDCTQCHTTNPGWNPATFLDHDKYYVLEGAHKTISCAACHKNNNYNNTPNTCFGCHDADYTATTNPNHATAGITTGCSDCHTQTAWIPSNFNHSIFYPLTGAHATIANNCKSCHTSTYDNTPNTCAGCHTADYQQAKSPDHVVLNFPMDCAACHTTNPNWRPATFNHNQYYPLKGAHAVVANNCKACHNATYTNTPTTCYGCHKTDYDKAVKPNHLIARFPQTCAECHSETAWAPSTFDHDRQYFPIYTGTHRQEWNTCTECHTNPSNFAIFSCIDCHEHNNATQVGADHRGVSGYKYLSTSCLECHPDGRN